MNKIIQWSKKIWFNNIFNKESKKFIKNYKPNNKVNKILNKINNKINIHLDNYNNQKNNYNNKINKKRLKKSMKLIGNLQLKTEFLKHHLPISKFLSIIKMKKVFRKCWMRKVKTLVELVIEISHFIHKNRIFNKKINLFKLHKF